MKTFRKIAGLMFAIIMSVALASCSDDDDEPNSEQPTPSEPTLVGTWVEKSEIIPFTLVLNADHTGTLSYDTTDSRALLTDHFNWSTTQTSDGDKILTIIHTSGDVIFATINNEYVFAGNELIVIFDFLEAGNTIRADFHRI